MSVNTPRFCLFKRPNHIYYIAYHANGRRRWKSTSVTTKPEALKALTEFRRLFGQQTPAIALSQFVRPFLEYSEANHAPKTVSLFRAILANFLRCVHDISMAEVTAEHIDRYKTKRLKEIKPVSVNVELRMLRSAFNTAKRWKMIEASPTDGIRSAAVPEQAPHFFTAQDFQTLIERIQEGWLREVVLFAVLTGMRKGEILNLRWPDIDMSRKTVNIQSSPSFKTKQGRRRTIPLNDSAYYLLTARQGRSPSEYVSTLNDKPINPGWVTHLFKRYVQRAKHLDERLHFHSLRHYAEFQTMPSQHAIFSRLSLFPLVNSA